MLQTIIDFFTSTASLYFSAGMVYLTVGFVLLLFTSDARNGYADAVNDLTGHNPITGVFWFYLWPLAFAIAVPVWFVRSIREALRDVQS